MTPRTRPDTRRPARGAALRALALAAATLAAALVAFVPQSVAAASPKPAKARPGSCAVHARGALTVTRDVVVFERPVAEEDGTRIYACHRPGGAAVLVGEDLAGDDQYGSDSVVSGVRVVGSYVAATLTTGEAQASQCAKYTMGDGCPSSETALRVVDTRRARSGSIATGSVDAFVLSPGGAVAWLDEGVLRGAALTPSGRHGLAAAPRELDHGAIVNPRFRGTTLVWRNAGVLHRQDLRAR